MEYFISLQSTKLSEQEKNLLEKSVVCGVLLFGRNVLSYETTKKLVNEIKAVRSNIKIAVDEEGGIVSRFTHLIANYSQPYISTLPLGQVRDYYRMRSQFLKGLGVDVNFAPVVDISLSEDSYVFKRSYGSDLEKIITLSNICIEEQRNAGLLSCIKHFPGHGRAIENSHEKLPVVSISQGEWNNMEFKVFKSVIGNGVDCVMVGHLLFPKISDQISSVSNYWINDVLKQQLNFKGKVICDDIFMKGLSESIDTSTIKSFEGVGLNQLIISDPENPILTRLV